MNLLKSEKPGHGSGFNTYGYLKRLQKYTIMVSAHVKLGINLV